MLDRSLILKIAKERSAYFIKLLNLQDWDIYIGVGEVDPGTAAENDINAYYLASSIILSAEGCHNEKETIEHLLHEMVHLLFREFYLMRTNMEANINNEQAALLMKAAEESAVVRFCRILIWGVPQLIYGKWDKE